MSDHACSRVEPFQPAPGAWYGREMRARDDWSVNLDGASLEEVERAVAGVEARGLSILDIGRDDFPLPLLGPELRALSRELIDGRGFALIRGLPVGHLGRQRSAIAYWGMGRHLGEPITQNPLGHMLGHVKDIGADADGVDSQAQLGGEARRFHGAHLARGVGTVGKKNENTILGGSITQTFDAEPDGIADRRLLTGESDHRLFE